MLVLFEIDRAAVQRYADGEYSLRGVLRLMDSLVDRAIVLNPESDEKVAEIVFGDDKINRHELKVSCKAVAERLATGDPELTDENLEILHRLGWLAHSVGGHARHTRDSA